jgi:hypothetical protein
VVNQRVYGDGRQQRRDLCLGRYIELYNGERIQQTLQYASAMDFQRQTASAAAGGHDSDGLLFGANHSIGNLIAS